MGLGHEYDGRAVIGEDLDGEIWVGTADGVAVFFSPFDAFSSNPSDARQILVEQDGIFQFLLEGQSVSCIEVDGANRKWVGTFGSGNSGTASSSGPFGDRTGNKCRRF